MKQGRLYANLAVLAAGILLIIFHNQNLLSTLIVIMGVVLMLPCAATLLTVLLRRERDASGNIVPPGKAMLASAVIASLGGMGLGVWMILSPGSLVGIVVYLFAAMLIIAGLYQIIMLAVGHRPVKFPWWMYVLPVLMVAAGVVILCTDIKTVEHLVVLITGISTVAFALNGFVEMVKTDDGHTQR